MPVLWKWECSLLCGSGSSWLLVCAVVGEIFISNLWNHFKIKSITQIIFHSVIIFCVHSYWGVGNTVRCKVQISSCTLYLHTHIDFKNKFSYQPISLLLWKLSPHLCFDILVVDAESKQAAVKAFFPKRDPCPWMQMAWRQGQIMFSLGWCHISAGGFFFLHYLSFHCRLIKLTD